MALAFVFPGQGSQAPGMGAALAAAFPAAREVFERVDAALGEPLSRLMFEGPAETLTLTENAQPALMAVSAAVMAVLRETKGVDARQAAYLAGHSLGEYAALVAADAISLEDAARVLRVRGRAMQAAVPEGMGAMAALLGADRDQAEALCAIGAAYGVCEIANDNAPGQIVISGDRAAVDAAAAAAKGVGVKKAALLPVSAPFHCSLMAPAAAAVADALSGIEVRAPVAPIVANVTAAPVVSPADIRELLVRQVTAPVRWRETVAWMAGPGGVQLFAEAGAGRVLTQMLKRAAPDATGVSIGDPDELHAFVDQLNLG